MTTAPTARRYAGTGLLMLACVSWGLSTALTKIALDRLTPVDLFGIEIVVSAVPLVLLALARGARPGRPSPAVLLLGVLEPGLTYLLFDLGVRRTAASHAALLLALDAPVTLVLAVAFLGERVDRWLLTSLAAGVGGSVLVTWRADGAGSSVIPFLLFNRASAQLTASRASLIGVLVPVIGAGASVLLLGERITRLAALGGILAVVGAALATRREDDSPSNDEETVPPIVLAVEEPCA